MARMSATFCPHCGTPFQRRAAEQTSPVEHNSETTRRTSAVNNEQPSVGSIVGKTDDTSKRIPLPLDSTDASAQSPAADSFDFFAAERHDGYEAGENRGNGNVERGENSTTNNRQRVTTNAVAAKAVAARGQLEENLRPRVAKLKQTSSTVLDEAANDSGLRFVLVAAALFLLAVVLLLFSKLLY